MTAGNVCKPDKTLQLDYTKQVLEYRIEVNYLTYSLFELRSKVDVESSCGSGGKRRRRRRDANDAIISVTISGDYQSVLLSLYLRLKPKFHYANFPVTSATNPCSPL